MKKVLSLQISGAVMLLSLCACSSQDVTQNSKQWLVDSQQDWLSTFPDKAGVAVKNGRVEVTANTGTLKSQLRRFDTKRKLSSITVEQTAAWNNWAAIDSVGPKNRKNAPVFLPVAPGDYWLFAQYSGGSISQQTWQEAEAERKSLGRPLKANRPLPKIADRGGDYAAQDPLQENGSGGWQAGLGGYHAWHSRDMRHWTHHGPVSEHKSRWVTSVEYADGAFYIYYDNPNDQDPHLLVDDNLLDGKPGNDFEMVFADPSDGSDAGVIRLEDGSFHLIYENWGPIKASARSWDSPLAGHAVSPDGIADFKILPPVVDHRTAPTGEFAEYKHPHAPGKLKYEIHRPQQNAYGDWSAIRVGEQFYLFGDYDKPGHFGKSKKSEAMSVAIFTSPSLDQQFQLVGEVGKGHPDPTIGFAEGRFYLMTQTESDFISSGPWVRKVELRLGFDTSGNGEVDFWSSWQEVREQYRQKKGFSRLVDKTPAQLDLLSSPECYGFEAELRISRLPEDAVAPVIERLLVEYE